MDGVLQVVSGKGVVLAQNNAGRVAVVERPRGEEVISGGAEEAKPRAACERTRRGQPLACPVSERIASARGFASSAFRGSGPTPRPRRQVLLRDAQAHRVRRYQ